MALRHTIYCKHSVATVTPEQLLNYLKSCDFLTLGEHYDISEEVVDESSQLQIKNMDTGKFLLYHLTYGESTKRPIEIDRWETEDQLRGEVNETIEELIVVVHPSAKKISEFLQKSVDSVSVSFGFDPPAAMFAWEIVRYFASEFDGIIKTNDDAWFTIGSNYQPIPV